MKKKNYIGESHFIDTLKTKSKLKLNIPELNLPDNHPLKPYLIEFHLVTSL